MCFRGDRVLSEPLQVQVRSLRAGKQTLWRTPGLWRPQRRGQLRWVISESSRPLRPHRDECFSSLVQQVMISPFCVSGCSERALWECPGSTVCIKASMICDGFPDCPQLVDETNCCKTHWCWCYYVLFCAGRIIPFLTVLLMICIHISSAVCRDNELSCNNHQCVHRTLWCDGKKHCSDSSDEWNCGRIVSLLKSWVVL